MKKLPFGIQTFKEIINNNYIYVDKTKDIYNLIEKGSKYYFLSRPRRFGKSLLISTLREIFSGNKELFKDLWIYNQIEWKKHPVIHIDYSSMNHTNPEGLENSISIRINDLIKAYQLKISEELNFKDKFRKLIEELSKIDKVVILIDEYDKPIIDHIEKPKIASENKEILKSFYETIKACDEHIRFAFLTGVSKFAKVSVFSGLNNLQDITIDDKFSTMLGYTENELYHYFSEYIEKFKNIDLSELKKDIKYWYNGYSWDGKNFVYNPFSILALFTKQKFNNYWFSSGTPTFLIKTIKESKFDILDLESGAVGEYIFDNYNTENIDVKSLLFQTGYLTVKEITTNKRNRASLYILKTPNFEVRESLFNYLLADFANQGVSQIQPLYLKLLDFLEEEKMDYFINEMKTLFSKIPYTLHLDKEAYYHSIFFLILSLMGIQMNLEELSIKGRIDGVLEFDNLIYIIEFKYGKKSDNIEKLLDKAINQIKDKEYYSKFMNKNKKIKLLAVTFVDKEIDYKLEALI